MTFRQLYMLVLDKLGLPEGDRRTEDLIKTFINTAYLYVARFDHGVVEMELDMDVDSGVVYLPTEFLSMKKIIHPSKGILNDDDYHIIHNRLILSQHLIETGTLNAMMALVPDELVEDTDVPEINQKYHMYLVYYALFLHTDDVTWFDLFSQGVGELLHTESNLDSGSEAEYVLDRYYRGDRL